MDHSSSPPIGTTEKATVPGFLSYFLPAVGLAVTGFFLMISTWQAIVVWAGGLMFWTLFEYLSHRYLFHPWGEKRVRRLIPFFLFTHGRHHSDPAELGIGFLPVLQGYPFLLILSGLFYLLMGKYALFFSSGFIIGYCWYILMHYAIHTFPTPPVWLAGLWRNHHLHHSTMPDDRFGVTTLIWDYLFNTCPKE